LLVIREARAAGARSPSPPTQLKVIIAAVISKMVRAS
jgi:hypothetical protein